MLMKVVLVVFVCSLLLACGRGQNATQSNNPEIEWLKKTTLDGLVFVEGGTFKMGDVGYTDEQGNHQYFTGDDDNKVIRNVTLTSYHIQKAEVTFKEFDIFTEENEHPLVYQNLRGHRSYAPDLPAGGINWFLGRQYCQWVGKLIGYPMDLPTEAQWEYAARSRGLAVAYATDDGTFKRGVNGRDPVKIGSTTEKAGTYPPNPLGIYDMTGNVEEWVLDWYKKRFSFDDEVDPTGPDKAMVEQYYLRRKVRRGFGLAAEDSILYRRVAREPDVAGAGAGIRCVANVSEPMQSAGSSK